MRQNYESKYPQMNFDFSKLPNNVKIEATIGDLKVFAKEVVREYVKQMPHVAPADDDITDFEGMTAFLKIAPSTGYAKTSSGEIPHFKKGRKLFFRKSELLKWIESGKRKTTKDIDELAEQYLKRAK